MFSIFEPIPLRTLRCRNDWALRAGERDMLLRVLKRGEEERSYLILLKSSSSSTWRVRKASEKSSSSRKIVPSSSICISVIPGYFFSISSSRLDCLSLLLVSRSFSRITSWYLQGCLQSHSQLLIIPWFEKKTKDFTLVNRFDGYFHITPAGNQNRHDMGQALLDFV